MPNSLASTHKEAIAKELVRFVRLIPHFPGGITIGDPFDNQANAAAAISDQTMQSLYFQIFDTVLSILDGYGMRYDERLSAAVDIMELVRNKLTDNE